MILKLHKHVEYDILSQIFYELGDYDDLCQDLLVLDCTPENEVFIDDMREVTGEANYRVETTKNGNKKYVLYYSDLFVYFKEKFKKLGENCV